MEMNVVLAFWCVSILFVLTPGADWAYAILAGIKGKFIVTAVTGLVLGHFIAILCCCWSGGFAQPLSCFVNRADHCRCMLFVVDGDKFTD